MRGQHNWGEGQRLHVDEEGDDAKREQDVNQSPNPELAAGISLSIPRHPVSISSQKSRISVKSVYIFRSRSFFWRL